MDFKAWLKSVRKEMGLSQRALGGLIGKNRDAISNVEKGRARLYAADYVKIKELHDAIQK